MKKVYEIAPHVFRFFAGGSCYTGFEMGAEAAIEPIPLNVCGNTINPGDKIMALESGKIRTSYRLTRGYLQYAGRYGLDYLFENDDPLHPPHPDAPRWYLAFGLIATDRLLMLSGPLTGWDVKPEKIVYYD